MSISLISLTDDSNKRMLQLVLHCGPSQEKNKFLSHIATCSCCTAVFTLAEGSRFEGFDSSVYF